MEKFFDLSTLCRPLAIPSYHSMDTRLWINAADEAALAKSAAPDSVIPQDLPVYLCITRSLDMGQLHWVLAWPAYSPDNFGPNAPSIGFKVLEVRNPSPRDTRTFALRFSYK